MKLVLEWLNDGLAKLLVTVDGRPHDTGATMSWYVAGFNYSGDRGAWTEAELYSLADLFLLRVTYVTSTEASDDRSVEDRVSHDGGHTWRREPVPSLDRATKLDACSTNDRYFRQVLANVGYPLPDEK